MDEDFKYVQLKDLKDNYKYFLIKLFKECRPELNTISNISEEEKDNIILKQFYIEQSQLIKVYPAAEFNIIFLNTKPIGKIYTNNNKNEIRVIEIGLLKEFRRKGIGTVMLKKVINKAVVQKKIITLQVAWFNEEAIKFYKNLSFEIIKNNGIFYEMKYMQ